MTSTIFGKNPKKIKDLVAAFGTQQPTEAQNTSYHDVEIEPLAVEVEPLAYRLLHVEKELFVYNESLEHLRWRGFERHLRPAEAFRLLADNLEGKLESPELQAIAGDMLNNSSKYPDWVIPEWLSCAVERKGELLIAYLDPVGLQRNSETNTYEVQGTLEYSDRKVFSIKGKRSDEWIHLKKFSDDFITFFYGRSFNALPDEMKKEDKWKWRDNGAQVRLPSEGRIYPVSRGNYIIDCTVKDIYGASRGYRSSSKSSMGYKIKKDKELQIFERCIKERNYEVAAERAKKIGLSFKARELYHTAIEEYKRRGEFDKAQKLAEEIAFGDMVKEFSKTPLSERINPLVFPPGHKYVELPPLENNAQYNPPPLPINKQHSLSNDIKKIGHELGLSIMKDGIYWAIIKGIGAIGLASIFYETCNSNN